MTTNSTASMRLDKWLWAARFYKTRSLAADAIDAGKVQWQGQRAKPAREIKPGDVLDIVAGEQHWTVTVVQLNAQRRPASEAQQMYAESEASQSRRAAALAQRKLAPDPAAAVKGRPSKRAGRHIRRFLDAG